MQWKRPPRLKKARQIYLVNRKDHQHTWHADTSLHHTNEDIYIHSCVCVCVYVGGSEWVGGRECVCMPLEWNSFIRSPASQPPLIGPTVVKETSWIRPNVNYSTKVSCQVISNQQTWPRAHTHTHTQVIFNLPELQFLYNTRSMSHYMMHQKHQCHYAYFNMLLNVIVHCTWGHLL